MASAAMRVATDSAREAELEPAEDPAQLQRDHEVEPRAGVVEVDAELLLDPAGPIASRVERNPGVPCRVGHAEVARHEGLEERHPLAGGAVRALERPECLEQEGLDVGGFGGPREQPEESEILDEHDRGMGEEAT